MPLLGKAEKAELEGLILAKLDKYYNDHGAGGLLAEGLRVVVDVDGPVIDAGDTADPLAAVPIRSLFTALCYLTAGAPAMPREVLESLATGATSSLAGQINRLTPG